MDENMTASASKGGLNPMVIVGGIILLVAAVAFFMMSGSKTAEEPITDTTDVMTPAQEGVESMPSEDDQLIDEGVGTVQTFNIEAASFFYNPSEIRVKTGNTVKIVLTASDMMHDFNIDELGVTSETVNEGESTTIEFVAGEPGEYEYYCSVGNHRAQGQVGTLIVE